VTSDPECDGFGLGRVITFFAVTAFVVTGIIVGTRVTFLDAEAVRPGKQGNPPNRSQTLAHPKGERHDPLIGRRIEFTNSERQLGSWSRWPNRTCRATMRR
jgi:hypothetical protein